PLKPGYFGRLRHELDSPNLGGHLPPHHLLQSSLKAHGNGLWLGDCSSYGRAATGGIFTSKSLRRDTALTLPLYPSDGRCNSSNAEARDLMIITGHGATPPVGGTHHHLERNYPLVCPFF
ncbi:hypothetical protein AVEN_219737-1, partial [Araneus ventricosus]